MITKIKDLKKIFLNREDVMIKALVKKKVSSGLVLPDSVDQKAMEAFEEILAIEIVAKGINVDEFEVGQYISLKSNVRMNYDLLNPGVAPEERVSVIHKNNIEFAINKENYELL